MTDVTDAEMGITVFEDPFPENPVNTFSNQNVVFWEYLLLPQNEQVAIISHRMEDPMKIRKDLENIGGIVIEKKFTTSGWPYFKPLKLGPETFYTFSAEDINEFTSRRRDLPRHTPLGPNEIVVHRSHMFSKDPAIAYGWNSNRSVSIFESEEILAKNLTMVRSEDIASVT